MNLDGSNKRALTDAFDRAPSNVFWSEDNSGLFFVAEDRGSQNLWFVRVGRRADTVDARSADSIFHLDEP
jgi:Tol biopolymer transport system component